MTVRARLRDIAEAAAHDPKQALLDSVGDISNYKLLGARVLVATYIQPEQTKSGIYLPDRTLAEGRFQGKVGLVIQLGDLCPTNIAYQVGDWVMYRASDGFELFFVRPNGSEGTPCRILDEASVLAVIPDPAMVY